MRTEAAGFDFQIEIDGRPLTAHAGDTVAAALLRSGVFVFRHTTSSKPRGIFCGMGICFDCLVTIDDLPDQRACITAARPGMRVSTHKGG